MSYQETDGFKFYKALDESDWTFLLIESDRLMECIKYFETHPNGLGIAISNHHGYQADDINFLKEVPDVKAVYIQDPIKDHSALFTLRKLQWLLLSEAKAEFDFSQFSSLEVFRGDWNKYIHNLDSCSSLRELALWKFKSPLGGLEPLSGLKQLESLEVTQTPLTSLSGVEKLNKIIRLEFSYAKKLEDIEALEGVSSSLEALRFDCCKNIDDFNVLSKLKNLNELGLNNLGEIASISFLKDLPKLEHFSFVKTNVVDGDLSSCIDHKKLQHVGFIDKRHYSHKFNEIKNRLHENS